jgi:hypothetical protein
MPSNSPQTDLDGRFSSPAAAATPWADAVAALEKAEIFWLTTVRPDSRPHVTPLLAVWMDDALYFCSGETEQKTKNLARNAHCILTTSSGAAANSGFDIVIEGDALPTTDESKLRRLADRYKQKFGWTFTVRDGVLVNDQDGPTVVYEVRPQKAFGFGRGETFTQTRWRF